MKKIFVIPLLLVLLSALALATMPQQELNEAKQLIDSKIDCQTLTDSQLELLGDYYMEQMHPGEAHELMDQMMGGEGSESLRQVHINMAKRLYCNQNNPLGYGVMGPGMMGYGGGMMPFMLNNGVTPNAGIGFWFGSLLNVLYFALLVGLVVLVYLLILKTWKRTPKGDKK